MEKENNVIEIRLSDFWKVLKRCWWVLLAAIMLFSGLFYLVESKKTPTYKASAKICITRSDGKTSSSDANLATNIIEDCVELVLSADNVIVPVLQKYDSTASSLTESQLKDRAKQLLRQVSVKTLGQNSHILEITALTLGPETSRNLANRIATAGVEYLNDLYSQKIATITDTANLGIRANPTSYVKILLVGLAAAAAIYVVWLMIYLFDDRIDSEEKVEKRLGLTILGSIPYQGGSSRRKNRYGSSYGYYGYGSGAEQQKAQAALSSDSAKKEGQNS